MTRAFCIALSICSASVALKLRRAASATLSLIDSKYSTRRHSLRFAPYVLRSRGRT
jgi:hypothetical protein